MGTQPGTLATAAEQPLEARPKAVIVGASRGIGAALARRLAAEGYDLALVSRDGERLQALAGDLRGEAGRVLTYTHDVHATEEVPALLQRIAAELGGLDLFIYNAGVMFPADPERYVVEEDLETLRVNTLGAVAWLNPVALRFRRAGHGHIVAIGSIAGDRGRRGNPAYAASKAALHAYLEGLRNRLARHGVTVTTIKPGQVRTEMLAHAERVVSPVTPEAAAEGIWRAIRARRQTAYVPGRWRWVSLVVRAIPSFIFRRLAL